MNEAAKHLGNALNELRRAKPHLRSAEDVQACVEAILCTEILVNKYAEEPAPTIEDRRHD